MGCQSATGGQLAVNLAYNKRGASGDCRVLRPAMLDPWFPGAIPVADATLHKHLASDDVSDSKCNDAGRLNLPKFREPSTLLTGSLPLASRTYHVLTASRQACSEQEWPTLNILGEKRTAWHR
jgi:hypothetical protein